MLGLQELEAVPGVSPAGALLVGFFIRSGHFEFRVGEHRQEAGEPLVAAGGQEELAAVGAQKPKGLRESLGDVALGENAVAWALESARE